LLASYFFIGLVFLIKIISYYYSIKNNYVFLRPNFCPIYITKSKLYKHDLNLLQIAKYTFSFDFFITDYLKNILESDYISPTPKVSKGIFIRLSNYYNLFIIMFFSALLISNRYIIINYQKPILLFLFFRIVSRSLEVIFAFVADVTTENGKVKTSNLNRYDRLTLAINSYIEIVLSYAIFYYFLFEKTSKSKGLHFIDNLFKSIGTMTFTDVKFLGESSKSSVFLFHNLALSLQIITSLVLVVFAIASYLSSEN